MTAIQQLEEIKAILNVVFAPTIRIREGIEYPMSEAERVQWVVNELRISRALNKLHFPQNI